MALRLVHVRILAEGDIYAAQCLEYDICAQGKTPAEAIDAFRRTMRGQIILDKVHGKEPLADAQPAPFPYWLGIERANFVGIRIGDFLDLKGHAKSCGLNSDHEGACSPIIAHVADRVAP